MNNSPALFWTLLSSSVFLIGLISANEETPSKIDEIYVEKCEKQFTVNDPKPDQLCEMRKLLISEATDLTKTFADCILQELGYFDQGGKIDRSALMKDYREQGIAGKDAELSSMMDDCEKEFGTSINSVNYLLCITMETDFASVINSRNVKEGKWKPVKPACE